jgi:tight adherence protein C
MDALLGCACFLTFVSVFSFLAGLLATRQRLTLVEQLRGLEPEVQQGELALTTDLDGTFRTRVATPILARVGAIAQRLTPRGAAEQVRLKLERAGNPPRVTVSYFMGLRVLSTATFIGIALLLLEALPITGPLRYVMGALVVLIGVVIPDNWLQSRINARERLIRRALPDGIDILVACAEAGLGLEQGLAELIVRRPGPLSDEFDRLLKEINLGKTRIQAWRDLAERVPVDGVRSFAAGIYQAEELGTSIASVLRVQAQSQRLRRSLHVREAAAKLPTTMLFPLVFCIFPAIFVVLLGPAMVTIIRALLPLLNK